MDGEQRLERASQTNTAGELPTFCCSEFVPGRLLFATCHYCQQQQVARGISTLASRSFDLCNDLRSTQRPLPQACPGTFAHLCAPPRTQRVPALCSLSTSVQLPTPLPPLGLGPHPGPRLPPVSPPNFQTLSFLSLLSSAWTPGLL